MLLGGATTSITFFLTKLYVATPYMLNAYKEQREAEKEADLFSNWLAGEDGILKKNDLVDLMTRGELDQGKFLEKIQSFNEALISKDPPAGSTWEPRHIYTGAGVDRTEQLANIRKVVGGYEIDTSGDGTVDINLTDNPPELATENLKELMTKNVANPTVA